jgi:hypothetical protein
MSSTARVIARERGSCTRLLVSDRSIFSTSAGSRCR